jgi:protein TonB
MGMVRISGNLAALLVAAVISLPAEPEAPVVRLSEQDVLHAVTVRVQPEYPAMARQLRLAGEVKVEVLIGSNGLVEKAKVLSGNMLLSSAAIAAVKKWRFDHAALAAGKTAKVVSALGFSFKL